jgi:S1-C subfamily serine protease
MDCGSWGFTARGITRELALEFSLPDQRGVFVAGVKPNGAAFQARLFPGDRIVAVNDEEVSDLESLRYLYRARDESRVEKVLLTVMRRHSRRWILIEAVYEN